MLQFQFGYITFESSLAIGRMNHGIKLDLDKANEIFNACLEHFINKPFVYITIREHSYSVDPLVYIELSKLENFKAMAIVTNSVLGISSTHIEAQFIKKPFKCFTETNKAKEWALSILNRG